MLSRSLFAPDGRSWPELVRRQLDRRQLDGGDNPFAAPLQSVRIALAGPPAYLERCIIAAAVLLGLTSLLSIGILFLARKRARRGDFFIFRMRYRYIVPSSSMSFLAVNSLSCAALTAYAGVIYASLETVELRVRLQPYWWLACVFSGPWTAVWFSFLGNLYGLVVAPSEHFDKGHGALVARLLKPVIFNIACLGAPIALIAVTIPLGYQLSAPATAVYRKILLVAPLLEELNEQYEMGGFAAINLTDTARAQQLGTGISGQYSAVQARWRYCWSFWVSWLSISLLLCVPVFIVLLRRLRASRRIHRLATSRATSPVTERHSDNMLTVPRVKELASYEPKALESSPSSVSTIKFPPASPPATPTWAPPKLHVEATPTLEKWTDEARLAARQSLLRTTAHAASLLGGLSIYLGLLGWLLTIDPIQASADMSAIAHIISLHGYAVPSFVSVCLIAARLFVQQPYLPPEVTRQGSVAVAASAFTPISPLTPLTPESAG